MLLYVRTGTLKLLHPYMPFITEEVYGYLPGAEEMCIRDSASGVRCADRIRTSTGISSDLSFSTAFLLSLIHI